MKKIIKISSTILAASLSFYSMADDYYIPDSFVCLEEGISFKFTVNNGKIDFSYISHEGLEKDSFEIKDRREDEIWNTYYVNINEDTYGIVRFDKLGVRVQSAKIKDGILRYVDDKSFLKCKEYFPKKL